MTDRLKYIILLLLCGQTACLFGQTDASWTKPEMRTSLILNAGISDNRQPALGFTVAYAGNFGFYVGGLIGLDAIHIAHDFHIDSDGRLQDGAQAGLIPFYSGERAYNRFSATTGAVFRMKIPLFAYAGAGYGYRSETRELLNKQWVETAGSLGHSAVVEAGLMGQIGNFILQAGYTLFIGQQNRLYHEAKVGIGYTLEKKF